MPTETARGSRLSWAGSNTLGPDTPVHNPPPLLAWAPDRAFSSIAQPDRLPSARWMRSRRPPCPQPTQVGVHLEDAYVEEAPRPIDATLDPRCPRAAGSL